MMLYKTVYAVRQGSCVNNFAIETAEINIEVKHHPQNICKSNVKKMSTTPKYSKKVITP